MEIKRILSTRSSNSMVYSDLIYEWEDDFSQELSIPIYSNGNLVESLLFRFYMLCAYIHLESFLQLIDRCFSSKKKILCFTLYPSKFFSYRTSANKIPFIVDFDYNVDLNDFYRIYRNCALVIISSRVAFEYLKEKGCPLNIAHVPLSLKSNLQIPYVNYRRRKYDIFVARQNEVLMQYLSTYIEKYPKTEYVIRKWEDNKLYSCNAYYSNLRGRLGEFSDRSSYFNLLSECRVAFYSTPGCDNKAKRFMNHVTPSLLEYLTAGCKIVARYQINPDTLYYNFPNNFENMQTYAEFESLLNKYLNSDWDHIDE